MISIIAAIAENGVIGYKNALPWHIAEDLRRFKTLTGGHPVVMGYNTFRSLGKPLAGRVNVVITRQNIKIAGCTVVHSLDEAIKLFPAAEEIFIIGGVQIYAAALPVADRLYLTRIAHVYEGDAHFPEWNPHEWRLMKREPFARGADYPYPFAFETYEHLK